MFIKTRYLFLFIFLLFFSNIEAAPNSNTISKDDKEARFTESTEELIVRAITIDPETHPGNSLYQENCAGCHNGSVEKAPATNWLEALIPQALFRTMNQGIMMEQSSHLTEEEKIQIVEFLMKQNRSDFPEEAELNYCSADKVTFDLREAPEPYGWGYNTSRFIPKKSGGLDSNNITKLKLKWAFGFPYSQRARSQPLFALGSIFVGSQSGDVYALDLETGCVKWNFTASAEVRTAIIMDEWKNGTIPSQRPYLYFGDIIGNAYAIDAQSGELIWKIKANNHPNSTITAAPAIFEDKLFIPISGLEVVAAFDDQYECCTFRGGILVVESRSGKQIWKQYSIPVPAKYHGKTSVGTKMYGPSGAPIWTSPNIDKKRRYVYIGTGENYSSPADDSSDAIIAYNIDTGKEVWRRQTLSGDAWNLACMAKDNPNCPEENGPDLDYSASSISIDLGYRDILVAGQKSGVVYGLDPDTGEILWSNALSGGGTQGGVHFGMASEGETVYVPLHDMEQTNDGKIYEDLKPGVHSVDAKTGELLWSKINPNNCGDIKFCDPGVSAALTAIPGAVIAGHQDGKIRIYDKEDGEILWSFDALREFESVSGVPASGGGFSGPGSAVRNGYMAMNSGYGIYYHMPGNSLLLFSVD
jgi:polyvinyl alcohol dehydrogenase (cytochrome)